MTASAFAKPLRIAMVLGATALCGACSSLDGGMMDSLFAHRSSNVTAAQKGGQPDPSEKIVTLPMSAEDLNCPSVEVRDDAATLRVGGDTNASVRYQFDIVKTARQCDPAGHEFKLKVGVSGNLLIGPAGKPGAYSAPLQVSVLNASNDKTVYSKTYKIEANTNGGAQAAFELVSEPIVLPLTRPNLDDDYAIVVGFDSGHTAAKAPPHKRPRAKTDQSH